jgi:YbbR domain-containing protein
MIGLQIGYQFLRLVRWLARNLGVLILAFVLAVVVWVSAVVTADPNQKKVLRPVPIQIVDQDPGLLVIGSIPEEAALTLEAPSSVWEQIENNPGSVRAWVDLAGVGPGEHTLPVKVQIGLSPIRYISTDPAEISIKLEALSSKTLPVELIITGEPPLGYKQGEPVLHPEEVQISGPESAVSEVVRAVVSLDISGASQTVTRSLSVQALDKNGAAVNDVIITPKSVTVVEPIDLLRGFKNVAVKVVTEGRLAEGYRLTSITVTPPIVTVSSDNPQLINQLPGFIETTPVDLTGMNDDTEVNVALNLPTGISLVREPGVLVQVGIAAIEGSLKLSIPVEFLGLPPGYTANASPTAVDLIITGPLPVLDTLSPSSFRVVVDLTDLPPNTYQITPVVDLAPEAIVIQAMLPETVEVTISIAPTPSPTPRPNPAVTVIPPNPTPTKKP